MQVQSAAEAKQGTARLSILSNISLVIMKLVVGFTRRFARNHIREGPLGYRPPRRGDRVSLGQEGERAS